MRSALQLWLMRISSKNDKSFLPVAATAAGILFVSTASIFIRFAQSEASSIVIAAARLFIASVVLVPIALTRYRHEYQSLTPRDKMQGVLSGVFLTLHFVTWISSLELTSIASSVVLVTTTPLWVAIFSPIILKESISKSVIIGLMVSMAGSVIVGFGFACDFINWGFRCQPVNLSGQSMFGNFLALFGAWMAAGYMLMGRQLRKKLNTIPYIAMVYGIAAVILLVVLLIKSEPVFSYSGQVYIWLLALGLLPQLLGHSLFNWSLKYVSAAYVSLSLLGEPIGTIILALIFLNESPTVLEGVGAVLILAGILIGSIDKLQIRNEN